ncbi:hypothetical protein ACO0RG_001897 [Hanseniaspora osmophila]
MESSFFSTDGTDFSKSHNFDPYEDQNNFFAKNYHDVYSVPAPSGASCLTQPENNLPFDTNAIGTEHKNACSYSSGTSDILDNRGFVGNNGITSTSSLATVSPFGGTVKDEDCQLLNKHNSLINETPGELEFSNETGDKKKQQNRAAQRAFRQRKEAKLKELELKLTQTENDNQKLQEELESLRKQTMEMSMENKLLLNRQQNHVSSFPGTNMAGNTASRAVKYNIPTKSEFQDFIVKDQPYHQGKLDSLTYTLPEGETLMTISATWDFLREMLDHTEATQGKTFDLYEVMKDLKGNEKCHGHGAAYKKDFVVSVAEAHLTDF